MTSGARPEFDLDNPPGAMLTAPAETMHAMLRILDDEHGGMLAVLRAAGLDPEIEALLRTRLTTIEGIAS